MTASVNTHARPRAGGDDLAALRAELAALRYRVAVLEAVAHLRESDHDWLAVLVQTYPNRRVFGVRDLIADADGDTRLRAALAGMRPLMIAARLRRLARQSVPGFTLTREQKRDEFGCRWTLLHEDRCDGEAARV